MDLTDYYENYWSKLGFHPQRKSNPSLTSLIAAHIQPGTRLLDVGCGNGSFYRQCLPGGFDYLGVDLSDNAVSEAKTVGVNAQTIDDATHLPFSDESFDAALCLEVLEHLFQPQLAAGEILRVLRPGGVLIATVPNVAYWRRRIELVSGGWNPIGDALSAEQPWRDPHLRFFTVTSLKRMLNYAGFNPIEVGGHSTEYAGYAQDASGLRKLYFIAHSSRYYQFVEARHPSLLALRLHAVARKPYPTRAVSRG